MTRRVLIVDDDPAIRTSLAEALSDDGITVTVAESGARALALFEDTSPDVVLSDAHAGPGRPCVAPDTAGTRAFG